MLVKKINSETNQIEEFYTGPDTNWAIEQGFIERDVEQSLDGRFYLSGFLPKESYIQKRLAEYPTISEQLDMIYWDIASGTEVWKTKITEIKNKYPKE